MVFSCRIGLRLRKRAANDTSRAGQRPSWTAFSKPMSRWDHHLFARNRERPVQRTDLAQRRPRPQLALCTARLGRGARWIPQSVCARRSITADRPVRLVLGAGDTETWGVVMRGVVHPVATGCRSGTSDHRPALGDPGEPTRIEPAQSRRRTRCPRPGQHSGRKIPDRVGWRMAEVSGERDGGGRCPQ